MSQNDRGARLAAGTNVRKCTLISVYRSVKLTELVQACLARRSRMLPQYSTREEKKP